MGVLLKILVYPRVCVVKCSTNGLLVGKKSNRIKRSRRNAKIYLFVLYLFTLEQLDRFGFLVLNYDHDYEYSNISILANIRHLGTQ